jgi:hypothetical protein
VTAAPAIANVADGFKNLHVTCGGDVWRHSPPLIAKPLRLHRNILLHMQQILLPTQTDTGNFQTLQKNKRQ